MDRTLRYATCVVAGREGFQPSIGSTGCVSPKARVASGFLDAVVMTLGLGRCPASRARNLDGKVGGSEVAAATDQLAELLLSVFDQRSEVADVLREQLIDRSRWRR